MYNYLRHIFYYRWYTTTLHHQSHWRNIHSPCLIRSINI